MKIRDNITRLDEILAGYGDVIGRDLTGYRNHVYRMVNFTFALGEFNDRDRERIIIAGCFHDIGIWSGDTFDYLGPSKTAAELYLTDNHQVECIDEIGLMIDRHHSLRKFFGNDRVEAFRKGDLVDFSLGLIRFGLPHAFVSEVKAAFPNAGFHKHLIKVAGRWTVHHPLNPIPVLRW